MVFYTEGTSQFLNQKAGPFPDDYKPNDRVRNSGIYRCTTCGYEIVLSKNQSLPKELRCNRHYGREAAIKPATEIKSWQLVVAIETDN